MTTPHRATPEQWELQESWADHDVTDSNCILELRDRLAAAEQRIEELEQSAKRSAADVLADSGCFAGQHGLQGLADADAFWEQQPYGTRLYYGDGIADYLHRGVLQSAISALEAVANIQQQGEDAEPANYSQSRMASPRCVAGDLLEESKRLSPLDQRRELLGCAAWLLENYALSLEAAANSKPTPNDRQIRSSAPAGGLVERVAEVITDDFADVHLWHDEARAAILAVADWFDAIGYGATASILRQEVQRDA